MKTEKINLIKEKPTVNRQIILDNKIHSKPDFDIDIEMTRLKLLLGLPINISNEGINYLIDVIKRRATADLEYGQLFGYKDGEAYSIEFGGDSNNSVYIADEGPYKNMNLMSDRESETYYQNEDKYTVNYIEGKKHIGIQHNHTYVGLYAPSPDDFIHLMVNDYADYSICISSKEVWAIEQLGPCNYPYKTVDKILCPIEEEAKMMIKTNTVDKVNDWYGHELEVTINSRLDYMFNIYRVVL